MFQQQELVNTLTDVGILHLHTGVVIHGDHVAFVAGQTIGIICSQRILSDECTRNQRFQAAMDEWDKVLWIRDLSSIFLRKNISFDSLNFFFRAHPHVCAMNSHPDMHEDAFKVLQSITNTIRVEEELATRSHTYMCEQKIP
jgi:hypothetical protein